MKCLTLSILLFSALFRPALVSGQSSGGFPPVYELSEHMDDVITIIKPEGSRWSRFAGITAADVNRDGIDDIIVKCDSLVMSQPFVEHSYSILMPVVYIIYGGRDLPRTIYLDDPPARSMILRFHESSPFRVVDVKTGDVNYDGITDFIFNGQWWPIAGGITNVQIDSRLCVYYGKARNQYGVFVIDVQSPELKKIYDFERSLKQRYIDNYLVDDFNGDFIDDILLPYYYLNPGTGLKMHIVYGGQDIPHDAEVGTNSSGIKVTTIRGDTLNSEYIYSMNTGDFEGDFKRDIILSGGYRRTTGATISHILYGSMLSQYRQYSLWSLSDPVEGKVAITREKENIENLLGDNVVAGADLNGDGRDEMVIGYPRYLVQLSDPDPRTYLNAQIYILFGAREQLLSAHLNSYSGSMLTLESAEKGDLMGGDFARCDINGDGYEDLCIAGADNYHSTESRPGRAVHKFYILFGNTAYSEFMHLRDNEPGISVVKGSVFFATGDVNGDGYDDILCDEEDSIYVITGRGRMYECHETITIPIPEKYGSYSRANFADGSRMSISFIQGRPMGEAAMHVTNFGTNLPDSLEYIATGTGAHSYFDLEVTGLFTQFQVRLSITYSDSHVTALGIRERDLIASRWNEERNAWERLESTIDTVGNEISFMTSHFSLFAVADTGNHVIAEIFGIDTGMPENFMLYQNYPNPFNPVTTIRCKLASISDVRLTIYNILGQEVRRLVKGRQAPGNYDMLWDARDNTGIPVASGVYLYRLTTDTGFSEIKKMVLIR